MAYQNNNNRVVPRETLNVQLNPVASPTNQEIRYQVDLSQAKTTAANADALAKLGQGVLDIDYTLNRKAQDSILEAEYQTIAEGGNQRDWADVSKNVQGMAKFNPYIRDAFRTYTAQDIYRTATLKLQSNPNVLNGKMTTEQYHKFKNDTITEMMSAYNAAGLKPSNYGAYVEKIHDDILKVDDVYLTKNAEYTYNNSLAAMAHDTAIRLGANTAVALDEGSKLEGLKIAFQETIDTANSLGVPPDELVSKVLGVGLSEYLINNTDKVNSATVIAAMKDIKINGKTLNEIIPNFDYQLQSTIKQIKRASYEDRKLEYDNQQLTLKIDSENATKEFFTWFKQNQNATPEQIQQQAFGLINKYNIDADGIGFLNSIANTRGLMIKLKENITDPTTYNDLTAKAVTGSLTGIEVSEAVLNGDLSPEDAFKLQAKMEAIEKQGATEFKQKSKRVLDSYISKEGAYYRQTPPDVRNNINTAITQIQNKLDRGEYTASQAQAKLNQLEKAIPNMLLERQVQNKNYRIILNGRYRNTQNIPTSNRKQAQESIVRMGLLRNAQGVRDTNVSIVSPQSNNRNGQKHLGNDLSGARIGRAVYAPSSGRIIASGFEETMGNYALFQDNRGKYILYMHLQNSVRTGLINRNTTLGYIGNTGRVSNKNSGCLHVEFWNQDLKIVRPEEW